jgi:ankyrin repeat protein
MDISQDHVTDSTDSTDRTAVNAFNRCVRMGNLTDVRKSLEAGVLLNHIHEDLPQPIDIAVRRNYIDIVKLLIMHGAIIRCSSPAWLFAVGKEKHEIFEMLFIRFCTLQLANYENRTAPNLLTDVWNILDTAHQPPLLETVIEKGSVEMLESMISFGAKFQLTESTLEQTLADIVRYMQRHRISEQMEWKGMSRKAAKLDLLLRVYPLDQQAIASRESSVLLHTALKFDKSFRGDLVQVVLENIPKTILNSAINPNDEYSLGSGGMTPIEWAIMGAVNDDPNSGDDDDEDEYDKIERPRANTPTVLKLLVLHGASLTQSSNGNSPLGHAVLARDSGAIKYICENMTHEQRIFSIGKINKYIVFDAIAAYSLPSDVKVLIDAGFDASEKNPVSNITPFTHLLQQRFIPSASTLFSRNAMAHLLLDQNINLLSTTGTDKKNVIVILTEMRRPLGEDVIARIILMFEYQSEIMHGKKIAFMSGLHNRLGHRSIVHGICADNSRMIIDALSDQVE